MIQPRQAKPSSRTVLATIGSAPVKPRIAAEALRAMRWADTQVVAGDFVAAAAAYSKAGSSMRDAWLPRLLEAMCWMSARRAKSAVPILRQLQSRHPEDVTIALLLQAAYTESGEHDQSSQTWLDTVRRFGDAAGNLDVRLGRLRLREARTQFPGSPLIHALDADLSQVARDWAAAETGYRRAIALAPRWTRPRTNLGIALTVQGKAREAVGVLEQGLQFDPVDARGRLAFADAQLASREPERALKVFREVESDPRFKATAQLGAGRAALAMGRERDALRYFEGARRSAPNDPAPAVAVAQMQSRQNDHRGAAQSYADALRLAEDGGLFSARPSLLRSLVEARVAAGDLDIALEILEQARSDQPLEAALWWRIEAVVWGKKSNFTNRDRALRAALDADSELYPRETLRLIDTEGLSEKLVAMVRTELQNLERPSGPEAQISGSAMMDSAPVVSGDPDGRTAPMAAGRAAGTSQPAIHGAPRVLSNPNSIAVPRAGSASSKNTDPVRERRAQCLAALGHLYQLRGNYASALSVRRELAALRGTGMDWFHVAEGLERANRRGEARDAWRQAVRKGGLPEPALRYAKQKLLSLGG